MVVGVAGAKHEWASVFVYRGGYRGNDIAFQTVFDMKRRD
jgi:hypothetical protein